MTYAFSLFNGVMQLGQNALGSSAGFKGNGMCFSTRGLVRRPWRSYGLVEDMEYSWTLRVAGEQILFRPNVKVFGAMLGSGGKAAADQRRRWEFGRSEIRNKYLGPLLRSPHVGIREKTLSACELTIPSMAWLAIIYVFVAGLDVAAWFAFAQNHTRSSAVYRRGARPCSQSRSSSTRFRRSWSCGSHSNTSRASRSFHSTWAGSC